MPPRHPAPLLLRVAAAFHEASQQLHAWLGHDPGGPFTLCTSPACRARAALYRESTDPLNRPPQDRLA